MTFRETSDSATLETSHSGAPSSRPKSRLRKGALPKVEAEPSGVDLEEEEKTVILEETPALSADALRHSSGPAEDPVRLYLTQMGGIPLLSREDELRLANRIEVGQIQPAAPRRHPHGHDKLLALVDQVRHGQIDLDEVILLPEGGEPKPEEIKPLLATFTRIRRLEREIERLQVSLADKRRSKTTRANYHKWIAQNRAAIQGAVEKLPLKPALVEQMLAELRRRVVAISEAQTPKQVRELESPSAWERRRCSLPCGRSKRTIAWYARPSASSWRPTCAWSCPWPSVTSEASSRSSTSSRKATSGS